MTAGVLDVLIAGKLAGTLSQDGAGSLFFAYERDYRGVPLSSSMPLSTRPYRDKVVLPYLWGLLPEDPAARRHVAADAGISPNNPFALLGVIGLDCPGAVQFVPQGSDAYRDERLVAVSGAEIARRLATGRQDGAGWIASNEHWSLGGQQSKFALRRMDGRWYSCEGSAATTHILKSGVRGLAHQALNEYVCMRLATSLGVPAASVEYLEFEGEGGVEPAIVIERYDRLVEGGQRDETPSGGSLPGSGMPSRQQVHHVRRAELRRSAGASHLDRAHCPGKRRGFPADALPQLPARGDGRARQELLHHARRRRVAQAGAHV